ncbi:MAG: DNA ligase D [Microvirga sp.]|nr:DNA ligase D [Microvirga sp.]
MALATYNRKRDFSRTPEPKGDPPRDRAGRSFVIQKHNARRLHYDLRLEMDGVLKSWAVTRGPSLSPSEKRLAVRVEDHPLEYGDFEGVIPTGEYGGGEVIVWDRGTWTPVGDAAKGLAKGHLEFEMAGEKLAGRWHLVRMAGKPREKRENWLLVKVDDEAACSEGDPDILVERPLSVKTGRTTEEVAGEPPGWSSRTGRIERPSPPATRTSIPGAKKAAMPDFIPPQLATLKAQAPTGEGWLHEIKFDGYRLQAHVADGEVRLLTRSGHDWTDRFGDAAPKALAALNAREAVIDGELVVEGSGGASDFSALQADLTEGRSDRFAYYAFDLLHLDGQDLRGARLTDRKAALAALLAGAPAPLRLSEHFDEDGDIVLRHACRLSLEGVISKRADARYQSGRNRDWIKSKCGARQEFVIGGYAPSSVSADAIGSLALGVFEDGKLRYVGRVGTGFRRAVAEDLRRRLGKPARKTSPFASGLDALARKDLRFVTPSLVAEVEFAAWTAEGRLRHASFRGLREDKSAREIVREEAPAPPKSGTSKIKAPKSSASKSKASKLSKSRTPAAVSVTLTNPDRVYWKDARVTKQDLAQYYAQVWRYIAPHVVARPLALLRCPTGYAAQCFFQKHAWRGMGKEILNLRDPKDDSDDNTLLGIDGLDGLTALVQGAALEIHPWQSTLDDLERPDQIVIDLDPGDGVPWPTMIEAARDVRARLKEAGLESFVKTTGGKGLHVVAPLTPKAGWDKVKSFAHGIADAMEGDDPDRFVARSTKAARDGRIYVDYLRNGRGATAIAPYSTRARSGATIAMPLGWDELDPAITSSHFTVGNAMARLDAMRSNPWADFRKAAAPLR